MTTTKRKKSGMYGETSQIKFGKYTISYMTEGETDRVWIQKEDAEGGEFKAKNLEKYIGDFFDKYL